MTGLLRVGIFSAIAIYSITAQVKESVIKKRYPLAEDGAFLVGGGAELRGVFDRQGKACVLTLGPVSENQVLKLFDALVPVKERGVRIDDLEDCTDVCQRILTYRNVSLVIGVVYGQASDPAAIITFSGVECKRAVADAYSQPMPTANP